MRLRRFGWRTEGAGLAMLLLVLCALPSSVAAAGSDPGASVAAYAAALNAHDVDRALALFDRNGSATDAVGHNFEGPGGLRQFLLGSGFGNPDAYITTQTLQVVGNRAIWTYQCTCAAHATDVRMVMINDKISVFAMVPPRASPLAPRSEPGVLPWLASLGVVAALVAGAHGLRPRPSASCAPRPSQGRLLAALMQAHLHHQGASSCRTYSSALGAQPVLHCQYTSPGGNSGPTSW